MIKVVPILIIVAFFGRAFAQQDSVKNMLQQRQAHFADSVGWAGYQFAKLNPLFITDLMPKQSSIINLGHQHEKGKFVEAQGNTTTNALFLSSEGSTTIKGTHLFGSFSYHKVFEDSTRFAHQTRNNPTTPFYFGSPANNHYERSIYDFNVLAARKLITDKLTAGLGLSYHIADHFSNNDPRGSIKEYRLSTKLALAYQLHEKLKVGLTYQLGYGQEKVNIGYKNRTYYESLVYPRYVNYLINGYGEPQPRVSRRNYNNFLDSKGPEFSLVATGTKLGSFYVLGSCMKENQVYDYRTGEEITDLSYYDLVDTQISLFWVSKPLFNGKLSAKLAYQNLEGEDFNLNFSAKNYLFTGKSISLTTNFTKVKNKTQYNYIFAAQNYSQERIDGITGNQVYFNNIQLKTGFGINQQLANYRSFGASLSLNHDFNINQNLSVSPANESYFTREVILHDYLYHTAKTYGVETSFNYGFSFFHTMQATISTNISYRINSEMITLTRSHTSVPGDDRFFSKTSLNLYF